MGTRTVFKLVIILLLIFIGAFPPQGFAVAPNIKYDGIYRSIENPFSGAWLYLRFFKDGTVLFARFGSSIEGLKEWYQPGGKGDNHLTIPAAKFSINGNQFTFTQSYGKDGSVDVTGEIKGNFLYTISKWEGRVSNWPGQNESHQAKFEFLPVYRKSNTGPTTLQICSLQEYLLRLGFDPGPVDGVMGKNTRDAMDSYLIESTVNSSESDFKGLLSSLDDKFRYMKVPKLEKSTLGLSRPNNGQIIDRPKKRAIAPLKITTSAKRDFYVKLQDHDTREDVTSVYIRAHSSSSLNVPLGNLVVKYATGTEWFSRACLFGVATSIHQAEKVLTFSVEGDQVSGYSIELILQNGGNFATQRLDSSDW